MMGDDDSGSLDSDSDLILDGENGALGGPGSLGGVGNLLDSDEDDDDEDDDELEVNEMAAETLKNRKSAKPGAAPSGPPTGAAVNSDDDF